MRQNIIEIWCIFFIKHEVILSNMPPTEMTDVNIYKTINGNEQESLKTAACMYIRNTQMLLLRYHRKEGKTDIHREENGTPAGYNWFHIRVHSFNRCIELVNSEWCFKKKRSEREWCAVFVSTWGRAASASRWRTASTWSAWSPSC